jgi:glucose-6-phosphate-specific signal transduction histidine kinase
MSAGNSHDKKLLRVIEQERRRLADELHDSIGQQVTGIAFLAKALEQKTAAAQDAESTKLAARLVEKANRLIEQTGYLAQRLQEPEAISAAEFPERLRNWARDLCAALGIKCVCGLEMELTDAEMATALFGLAREMIQDTLARCPQAAELKIEGHQTRGELRLNVSCEGDAAKDKRQTSIPLRVRANLLGATLRTARENSRWTLRAALPMKSRGH